MPESSLQPVALDISTFRMDLGLAELFLCWDIISEVPGEFIPKKYFEEQDNDDGRGCGYPDEGSEAGL